MLWDICPENSPCTKANRRGNLWFFRHHLPARRLKTIWYHPSTSRLNLSKQRAGKLSEVEIEQNWPCVAWIHKPKVLFLDEPQLVSIRFKLWGDAQTSATKRNHYSCFYALHG
jgi:ABC-type uncharacterized transport system ATPase subunit